MGLKDQLVRLAVNGIEFPCLEFRSSSENSSVAHRAYRVSGADVEHTGRGPRKFTAKAAFLTSMLGGGWPADLFPVTRDAVEAVFNDTPLCTLTHPYYGSVSVHFDKFDEPLDQATQQGVYVDLEFTETNASAETPLRVADPEPGAALTEAAAAADEAVAAITDRLDPLSPVVETKLAYLDDDTRDSAQAYGALADIQTAAQAQLDSALLAGIEGHDARAQLRTVLSASWTYAERYLTPKPQSRTYTTEAPMSLARAAAQIYGDASKAHLLRRANTIPDAMRVPAGFTFKVPDDE